MNPMCRVLLVTLAPWTFFALTCWAQQPLPPEHLSLERALRIALENHPRLGRRRHETAAAQRAIRKARAPYFPRVSVQGIAKDGLSGATGDLGLTGLPGSPFFDNFSYAVNVTYDLYDFGRTHHRVEAARFTAASLRSREEAEKAHVAWEVKTAYYRCLQSEGLLEVARQTLEDRHLLARQAQVLFEVQLRSKLDANLAGAKVSEAEALLVRAQNRRRAGFARLNLAMGVAGRETYHVGLMSTEPAEVQPLATLIDKALAERPELRVLQQRLQAARAAVEAEESERMPRVSGVASAGYARFETVVRDRWVVGVGFDVPVFTGFAVESRIGQAQERLAASELAREELLQRVRYEVTRASLDLLTAQEVARSASERASLGEQSLRLASQRYGARLGSYLEVAQAETARAEAERQRVHALYDVKIAEASLELAVGGPVSAARALDEHGEGILRGLNGQRRAAQGSRR